MVVKKKPINILEPTRDLFNSYRRAYSAMENKNITQDNFLNMLLEIFIDKNPRIKEFLKSDVNGRRRKKS